MSLSIKLILAIVASVGVVFVGSLAYNHHVTHEAILKSVEENTKNLTLSTVYKIESVLRSVERVPVNLACIVERRSHTRDELLNLIESAVSFNPEIFGSTIAFEPFAFDPKSYFFAPYYYREGDRVKLTFLGSDSYRYFYLDWYQIPREIGRAGWSEPYFDEGGGNIIMSTFSTPFYRTVKGKRELSGVITADVSLMWLKDIVSSVKIFKTGYAFLISRNGVIITHPKKGLIMRESLFSAAERYGDSNLRRIGQDMIRGGKGFVGLDRFLCEKKSWMYYSPLPSSGWSLGVVVSEEELFAGAKKLERRLILIAALGLALLCSMIAFISRTITRPLGSLSRTTDEISKGNLDIELPEVVSNDEIGRLTRSFGEMRVALKEYIANLAETTAAKERIESEVRIAREIQESLLPRTFPPFPEREEFSLHALNVPATEVGGDFFDFFFIDNDTIALVIADVSGKGISAALFMAVSRTLVRNICSSQPDPAKALDVANQALSEDNERCMFVTLFLAYYNVKTGRFTYTNAGHNKPLLLRPDGAVSEAGLVADVVLGVIPEYRYQSGEESIEAGDALVFYTDGITEAMSPGKELFGEERLKEILSDNASRPVKELCSLVKDAAMDYEAGARFDDITLMILRRET